ncbi:MAG: HAD-IA family hydrolase [Sedimenticola sp.]
MAELEALLFDVDGTLADTERDGHRPAFNSAFAAAGLDWDWDEAFYGKLLAVTGGKERIRHYLDVYNKEFEKPTDLDGFIASLHRSKTGFYVDRLERGEIPLRSGVRRLLNEARDASLRLAVVTTTTSKNVTVLLENGLGRGSEAMFEVIAAGDVVAVKKPAPDIYLWAMEQMNLRPDQCLAIEDSHNGLHSALAAKIRSLVVTVNGYTRDEDFAGASLVVDRLGEAVDECRQSAGVVEPVKLVDVKLLRRIHALAWGD